MILDESLEFFSATSIAAAVGTALVGDVVDLGEEAVYPFRNSMVYLVANVTETFTGGASTVQLQLAADAQEAIATDGSATVIVTTAAIPIATLVAGYNIVVPLPWTPQVERYLGVLAITGGATTTAGSISASITAYAPQGWNAYADAVN